MTGEGVDGFIDAVREGREEYNNEYKPEYERLKREREQLDLKKKEEKSSGKGKEVAMGLCHSIREEVEVPDNIRQAIFLKHPGDENDDDDDEEEVDMEQEEESREGDSFKNFIKNRTDLTVDKIKNQPQN